MFVTGDAILFVGSRVRVSDKNPAWAYVVGWEGEIKGANNGLLEVHFQREDGEKTLFVPPDLLERV